MKKKEKLAHAAGERVHITEQVKVKCFCGLWVTAGHSGPDDEPCLLHPVPACKKYMDMEPADFLKALRKKYAP